MLTFDALTPNSSSANRNSASFSHTTSGTDRTIVVISKLFSTSSNPITAVTYNGVALTQRVAIEIEYVTNRFFNTSIWTLDNPASGANTVAVTFTGTAAASEISAISYTGANNGVGANTGSASGNSDNPSVTFTTGAATSLIVGGAMVLSGGASPFTPGTGTTERSDGATGADANTDFGYTDGDEPASGGSDTIDFTASLSNSWLIVAIELLASGATTTTTTTSTTTTTTTTSTTTSTTTTTTSTTTTSTTTTSTTSTSSTSTTSTSSTSSTTTLQTFAVGIGTFHQSISLSISAFDPLVVGSNLVDDSLGSELDAYQHSISALGGYESATLTISNRQIDIEDWLANGLFRHIEVYNPALVKIWEGFVNQIDITLGGLAVTRGPIMQVNNNVALTYSTVDTSVSPPAIGMRATTAFNSDADSQTLYGVLETVLSAGGISTTEATVVRDVFLSENAEPQTSQKLNIGQGGNISLRLNCLGYYHLMKKYIYNQTANTGTDDLSDVLAAIIAADPNSIFSTSTSKITANALQVKQYLNDNSPAWNLIQGLVARGDSSDNRYIFGVYNGRVSEYEAIPTDFEYQQRLSDPAQRVETPQGIEVKPWDVKAGKWLFVPDFLIGQVQPSELRLDPRMIFIEQMTYTMPWNLSIQGGKVEKLPQKLAKLGLSGIGSGV